MAEHGLDLQLAWRRLVWETSLDPFETPDAFTQPSFLRRQEVATMDPQPLLDELDDSLRRGYRPEPFEPMLTSRGPGARPMACLSVRENLVMLACLGACQTGLAELFGATDARRDLTFQVSPDPSAVSWVRSPFGSEPFESGRAADRCARRAFLRQAYQEPGWCLRVDVSSCGYSLDYRRLLVDLVGAGLNRTQARILLRLFQTMAPARRHGIRSFGCGLGVLVKTYLNPVVRELDRRGHRFFLTDLDEFHLFAPTRGQVVGLLDELQLLLQRRGLTLNVAKTRLAPARWRESPDFDHWWSRVIPLLPPVGPVIRTLVSQLRNDRYTSRGPAFRELLHTPVMQQAALALLQDPESRAGDRYQVLYWLQVAGARVRGALRRHLESFAEGSEASAFERGLARGALQG